MIRTRFKTWIAKKPMTKPMILFLNGAGKEKIAANRIIKASTPLQPRSMRTPNPVTELRIIFLYDSTLSSKICRIQTLTSAMKDVNGMMTYSSAGCRISSVNRPTNSTVNNTKKRIINMATRLAKNPAMLTKVVPECTRQCFTGNP